MALVSTQDFRAAARRRLPRFLFDYLDGGATQEQTMRANEAALASTRLRQRVLRDVAEINLSCTIVGQAAAFPLVLAPVGLAGLYARRGETQAARAAASSKVPFCLSTVGACSIGEVHATGAPFWFQLYMIRDRAFMRDLMNQAREVGCTTLVFTVDMPVPGIRYRDYRTGLANSSSRWSAIRRVVQALVRPGWAWDVGLRGRPHGLGNIAPLLGGRTGIDDFFGWMRDNFDASVTWRDLDFVREHWPDKIIIKGILDIADARTAISVGADGVVVSNHGGRQLDGAPPTAVALPRLAEVLKGRVTVLADGGVRSGTDILKMLALGADAVSIGRPWVYALAADGEAGVELLLKRLAIELRVAMALTGVTSIDQVDQSMLT